jgi:ParB/RepB/Spo0J family partition protein
MTTVQNIPLAQITPDPGQPRKKFEKTALRELANSIAASGLLQPITVRQLAGTPPTYMIVAGERRYRASQLSGATTIRAIVSEIDDHASIRVNQIIENDQRMDVTALEQAISYQALMNEMGWSVEQLGRAIGKSPHRIVERVALLNLAPEYQTLLASGNLKPSEAGEMALLGRRGQATLFGLIRSGKCSNYGDLRAAAKTILAAEAQLSLMPDEPAPPTEEVRKLAGVFETNVERIANMLRQGISDNQIVAVKKTNPQRAGHLADLMALMQKDMRRIEVALREAAVQASFLET